MHTDDGCPRKLHNLVILLFLGMLSLVSACVDQETQTPSEILTAPAQETDVAMPAVLTESPTATPTPLPPLTPTATLEPCAPARYGALAGIDPRGQTVVWWHAYSRDREEILNSMVATFNATNACQITVELKNQDSYNVIREKMLADLLIFYPPNLLLGDQRDEALYALQGRIIDLAPLISDLKWGMTFDELQDFFPAFLEQGVHPAFEGQRLGFPANRTIEVLYYNQTLLLELENDLAPVEGASSTTEGAATTRGTLAIAGAPPRTPEQFRAMACAAAAGKADGTGGYILRTDAAALTAWTLAFGGNVLSPDGKGYVYNSEATIQAMTFLKELYDAKCAYFFTEGDTVPNAFAAREAVFTQGSSSAIPFYELAIQTAAENQAHAADQWNLSTLPYTPTTTGAQATPRVNAYGIDFMIPPTTPEAELAAWIVLKWFAAPEQQAQWVQISHDYPTRASTIEYLTDYVQRHPQWATGFEFLDHCAYEPPLISYSYAGVRSAVSEAMIEILHGADIQETLQILDEEANLIQEAMMQQVDNETP